MAKLGCKIAVHARLMAQLSLPGLPKSSDCHVMFIHWTRD
jgi:hypothetical protein